MSRITDTLLVQRVEDQIVVIDESTGIELSMKVDDASRAADAMKWLVTAQHDVSIIDEMSARHVLAWFAHTDDEVAASVPGSDFVQALINLCCHADIHNIIRLMHSFPAIATAVWIAKNEPDGLNTLLAIANGPAV